MARVNILHISDLHFGTLEEDVNGDRQRRSTHYFVHDDDTPDPTQLADILIDEFVVEAPSLVVVSGDIGSDGHETDYDPAREFFSRLRTKWERSVFVLTPGNHDVHRASHVPDAERQASFTNFLRNVYGEDEFKRVHPLFDETIRDTLVSIQTLKSPLLPPCADPPVLGVVISMNSAAGLQDKGTPVRIDPDTLRHVDRHLKDLALPEDALRIFVLHHHLLPFAESPWGPTSNTRRSPNREADPDLVVNSAKLHTWLVQQRFHLVLHGHKHTSHGRQDQLWRSNDRVGRSLLIVGAGSTGVREPSRAQGEHLTFNRLTATRFSKQRWQVQVQVRQIATDLISPEARPHYEFTAVTGVESEQDQLYPTFRAERMDDCHRAIAAANRPEADGDGELRYNFLSVVEDCSYIHPPSAGLRGEPVERKLIKQCFAALHPEHEPTQGWVNLTNIDRHLRQSQVGYRFEHGSRLFQSPDNRFRHSAKDVEATSPLLQVVEQLRGNLSTSKAYLSLYRAQIDMLSAGKQPLPGLMGLHFVARNGKLDLTASFRKLELSFWWCLNMYELGMLLCWVSDRLRKQAGRLTFFASLAQWKWSPDAPMRAKLDQQSIAELLPLVLHLDRHKGTLAELLRNKQELLNDTHLDGEGLANLEQLLQGLATAERPDARLKPLADNIAQANRDVAAAVNTSSSTRDQYVRSCSESLERAINHLMGSATSPSP